MAAALDPAAGLLLPGVATFVGEVQARVADLRGLLERLNRLAGDEGPRLVRASLRQVALLETAAEQFSAMRSVPRLDDLTGARLDRDLHRYLLAANDGEPAESKPVQTILADLAIEALASIARLENVLLACQRPLHPESERVLREVSAVFLPGESRKSTDRAIRDRIEAVTDAAAEVGEAIDWAAAAVAK